MRAGNRMRRRGKVLGVMTLAMGLVGLVAAPAGAVGENGSAFALKANGLVDVPPTPHAQCPGNPSPQDAVDVNLHPTLPVHATALEAECTSGNTPGGAVTAASRVAAVSLGGGNLPIPLPHPLPVPNQGLLIEAVESSCQTSATGATTHSSILTINGETLPNEETRTFEFPPGSGQLATLHINEVKSQGGFLVVNALRLVLLPNTALAQEVILAQSKCRQGGVIPEVPLAVLLPLSALAVFGAAYFVWRRRPGLAA